MNKFIAKIFKSAGVDAKVSKDSKNPRFKVVENKLTLEGTVRGNRYTMAIRDNTGKKIDNLSVTIDNSNDIVNRINESVNTLKLLSKAYDSKKLVEEDEEFDTVIADEDDPETLVDGLSELYSKILDVAEYSETLSDLADSNDAETLSTLISFSSSLYDCAIDVDDLIDDMSESDVTENVSHGTNRSNLSKAIDLLTICEATIQKDRKLSDITRAIKDIKSELVLRGR